MKKLLLIAWALLPTLQATTYSNYFTPFKVTNESGQELLAFPWQQAQQVLYRTLAEPHFEIRTEIQEKIVTNVVERETLRIQYITNTITAKKEQTAGRVIGGIVGGIVFGVTFGIVLGNPIQSTSLSTMAIGLGAGGVCFGIGCFVDLGHTIRLNFLFPLK